MNPYRLPDILASEIDEYEKSVTSYLNKEIPGVKMKVIRIPFGCYEQRDNEKYMVRIRLPGGAITPSQLIGVAELARSYSSAPLHFTTRQDIQIHSVELFDTIAILRKLYSIGLTTRGTGGNTVRGISASWDAGCNPDHAFDVSPYAEELTTRLIAESDSWNLPRKLKIAFSGDKNDSAFATVNDLGFIAKTNRAGDPGFAVFIGGGMGSHPQTGIRIRDFIPAKDTGAYAQAVKRMFDKYGNRKDKRRARLRFVRETLGEEGFVTKFEEELALVIREGYAPLDIERMEKTTNPHFIVVPFFLGDCDPSIAISIAQVAMPLGDLSLRVLPTQNLLVRNIPENDTSVLRESLGELSMISEVPPVFGNAVACAGASTCKLGIGLSRDLLEAIKEKSQRDGSALLPEIQDVTIKISGCPNSCGQHATADIGFAGVAKRSGEHPYPAYALFVGARIRETLPELGRKIATIPARHIPEFVSALFGYISAKRARGEQFSDFAKRCEGDIAGLAERFATVPAFGQTPDFFKDWGANEFFSLAKRAEGECSAGLIDLIEYDLFSALAELQKYSESDGGQRSLIESVYSSARALLVAKGLEAKSQADALAQFRNHFIGKHIDPSYNQLLTNLEMKRPITCAEAESFFRAIKSLYERMDNSLGFPEIAPAIEAQANSRTQEHKDLRGVPCPLNFVKTKLALESMKRGDILEVLLDDGEPIDNVPGSVIAEGHSILKQERVGDHWLLAIERGE
jgi:sulfite reductase (ferredoxin)